MGIRDWLNLSNTVAAPIKAVGDLYTTDKARIDAETKYQEVAQKPQLSQLENNKLLILTGNIYNLGWIALLGWTSGLLILLYYAPQIIVVTAIWANDCLNTGIITPFPMKSDDILNLVYLIFGAGGLGIAKNKLK